MRQRPAVESPTQSPAIVDIHPKLRRALEHVDVRLDEELTRYRRQKAGLTVTPTGALGWQRKSTPTSVALPLSQPPLPQLPSSKQPALSQRPAADQPSTSIAAGFTLPHDGDLFAQPSSPTQPLTAEPQTPQTVEPTDYHLQAIAEDDDRFSLANNAAQLDDYLESSEELLKSLATQKAQVQVEKGFLEHLATPLGIGSMLMLLLSSAMLGYVIMNPSSLRALGHLLPTAQPTPTPVTVVPATEPTGPIANSPPLDSQEFITLGLDSLTALGTRPSGKFAAKPALPHLKPSAIAAQPGALSPRLTPNGGLRLAGPNAIAPIQSTLRPPAGPSLPLRAIPEARTYSPATPTYAAPRRASAPVRSYRPPARPYSQPALPPVTYTPQPPAPLPPIRVTPAESYSEPSPVPQAAPPSPTNSTPAEIGVRFNSDQQLEQVRQTIPDAEIRNTADGAYIPVPLDKMQELQNQGIAVEPIPSK